MGEFTLPVHVGKLWLIRVTDVAGQVLPPGGFEFYGCAAAPRGGAVGMVARVRGDATELVLPGLCAPGAWDLSIFCREVATGVTWAVQQGRVNVTPAPGLPCGGVVPAVDELVAVLDPVTHVLSVVLGDSTASVAENARLAVAAREGAEAEAALAVDAAAKAEALKGVALDAAAKAALSAEGAEVSKHGAEAAAGDAAADAKVAEGKAAEAEVSREAAEAAQRQAEAKAAEAEASAKVAAEAVSDALAARDEAVAAQRGAEAAQVVAVDASEQAGRYAEQAVGAADGAVVAQGKAEAAKVVAVEKAAEAEEKAALLGDAALKGGDNDFSGNNSHSGTEVFNGAVALNGAVDARCSAMMLPAEVLRAMSSWPALVGPLCAAPDDVGLYLGAALEEEVLVMNLPNIKNLKFTVTGLMTSTVKRSGTARDGLMLNTAGCGTARVVVSIGPSIFCGNDNGNVYYDCEEMYVFLTSAELGAYALPRSTMKSSASGKSLKKLVIVAPYQVTCQQDFFSGCASELEDFVCIMPRISGFEQKISDGRGRMFRNLRGCRRARIYLPGLVTDLNLPNMRMDADSVVFLLDGLGDVSAAPCVATLGVGAGVADDADVQNAVAAAAAKGWTVIFNDNSEAY